MKIASPTIKELVNWLDGKQIPNSKRLKGNSIKNLGAQQFYMIWSDEDVAERQPIFAVPQSELNEFFAFVSTYISAYRPFSAFFKVVSSDWLEYRLNNKCDPIISKELYSKLIAVAFSEAFAQSRGKLLSLNDLSVQGVHATLSASLFSAVWKGYSEKELTDLSQGWVDSRLLVAGGPLQIPPDTILEVWQNIAIGLVNTNSSKRKISKNKVAFHLRQFSQGSKSFEDWFIPLAQETLGNKIVLKRMLGAREDRIKTLPELLDTARSSKSNKKLVEFVVGGIVSLVGNGSMEQIRLTEQLIRDFPSSPLWFGVASALQSRSDALIASNCLGRRAIRDLIRKFDLFDAPSYDISLDELVILGDKAFTNRLIRTSHNGTFEVGLMGDVHATLKRVTLESRNEKVLSNREVSLNESKKLEELSYLIDRAGRVLTEIKSPTQRDLFRRNLKSRLKRS